MNFGKSKKEMNENDKYNSAILRQKAEELLKMKSEAKILELIGELAFQNKEKAKRADELLIANKELAFQNEEKAKRAKELKELVFQNEEKSKRADELAIANKGLDYQNEELKRSEEALRNSNVFNETLLKTIPFGIIIVDETGTVLFLSDKFREIFGENAIGGKCWDLYKDDKKQCINCPLTKDVAVGKTETYESHGILGDRIFEINHTGMIYQGKKAILEIFQDITERKQAELALIQAKKQIEEKAAVINSVIESTSDWIWEVNEQGIYLDCSDKVEKILGYTAHEIVGKTPFDFMTDGEIERVGTIFQNKVQACEPIFDLENWNIHKDGHLVCLLTNGVPKFDETGKLTGYFGADKDITDKKNIAHQLEERLKEFQILYRLSQLAGEKDITLDAFYQRFVDILPEGWQYPGITCARIVVDGVEFCTENYVDSAWKLSAPIEVYETVIGLIEVAYLSEMPIADEGPFIKEERHLIEALALQLKQIIKRKKAEKALVESEEKLSLLMNSTAEGIYGIDLEGNCTHANKSCIELLGYKTENDFLGKNMHDLIHHSYSDHRPMKVEECKIFLAFRQGKGTRIDDEVLWRADGTSFPVQYYSHPIFKNEQIVGAVVTFTDITERRKAEEENVLQLALINSLLDSIPDVIFFKDTEGVYLGCNPPFAALIGKSRSEIIGKTDYDLFEKPIADTFRQFDQEMLVKKLYQHNEEWVTYPDGSNVLLDTLKTPYWGGDGILIGVLGISRDITARKKGEDALRKSEEKHRSLFEISLQGIVYQ
ncbi:MAG: PAS domain S-box protein, partial [Bacteroidales bacterium]